jgi:hypothetical protein
MSRSTGSKTGTSAAAYGAGLIAVAAGVTPPGLIVGAMLVAGVGVGLLWNEYAQSHPDWLENTSNALWFGATFPWMTLNNAFFNVAFIDQDALGLDRVYIQAKRYADGNNVGPGAIRDFFGSLDRFKATKGLFVTTSAFTSDARDTAELLSKRIVLIDGDGLTRLMVRFNVGCRVEETLFIRKVDEDFFSD